MSLPQKLKTLVQLPLDHFEEQRLASKAGSWTLPEHVGVILDGNRRFAKQAGLQSVIDGHTRGADKLHEVLNWFYDLGIKVVTIWIFSIDNFQRNESEVQGLFDLIESKTRSMNESGDVHDYEIRVRYVGRTHLLPESLREAIDEIEENTAKYDKHMLNVAIAYGGREEITDAVSAYLRANSDNGTTPAELAESFCADSLDQHVYTAGIPDPDLIIRTSGEYRLSGFLLWQSAYSEYYFCSSYWPEFRRLDLLRALSDYNHRQRRYGR